MTLIYGDTGSDKKNSGLSSETTASWDDGQKQLSSALVGEAPGCWEREL